jgi:hypothetical protein
MSKKPDLKVKLDAIELQNPVMSASGRKRAVTGADQREPATAHC